MTVHGHLLTNKTIAPMGFIDQMGDQIAIKYQYINKYSKEGILGNPCKNQRVIA